MRAFTTQKEANAWAGEMVADMDADLKHGDCMKVMPAMPENSVDSIVTDPPYGIGFMGKDWDSPGGTGDYPMRRTNAMNTVNTGVSRQGGRQRGCADFAKRQARDAKTYQAWSQEWLEQALRVLKPAHYMLCFGGTRTFHRLACAVEDAGWEVRDCIMWLYGSGFPKHPGCLKPAWEAIILARKPGKGVLPLQIDACRIPGTPETTRFDPSKHSHDGWRMNATGAERAAAATGRWPANVIHDGSEEVLAMFPQSKGTASGGKSKRNSKNSEEYWGQGGGGFKGGRSTVFHNDEGSAARFFYCAKASKADRGEGNTHPTVKPLSLMRHLCQLITVPGGTVFDPFVGSGSTVVAAKMDRLGYIGIDSDADYLAIAKRRLRKVQPLLV